MKYIFFLPIIILIVYPLIGLWLVNLTERKPKAKKRLLVVLFSVSFFGIAGFLTGISTISLLVDLLFLSALYMVIPVLLWKISYSKKKWLGILGILSFVGFYIVSFFVGFVALIAMVAGNYIPDLDRKINGGYSYKETHLGAAVSNYRGRRIEIYKTIPFLPFLERKVAEKEYYTNSSFSDSFPLSEDMIIEYDARREEFHLSVSPEDKESEYSNWKDTIPLHK
ncbi:hypothetical protein [Dysgonomonas sp. 25]|uniref:hypothetical protein n=1 Tax=Dysgonomonas sp. 25 TaxID=2302933 RepID=UPI0013D309EB|nr:hypothetical protein [Dysgonomonas sp. 25]NDV69091.1 hypothetical protein [Dysgonomonas sp. 25]